jgi:uncharacterized membrane protein
LNSTSGKRRPGFFQDFGKFFLRGLAAILPTLLTLAIMIWAYQVVDEYMGQYINSAFITSLARTVGAPRSSMVDPDVDTMIYGTPINEFDSKGRRMTLEYLLTHHPAHAGKPEVRGDESLEYRTALWRIVFAKYKLGLVGFLIAISLVYFVGFFVASFIGRTTWRLLERVQERVPLVNAIYPPIKQVTDFLLSDKQRASGGVVAIQYPRKGIYSIGLLTGPGLPDLRMNAEEMVTVFIPNSPTPITGYVVVVPRSDVIDLSMSMDEALRFVISGGVVLPGKELAQGVNPIQGSLVDRKESPCPGQGAAPIRAPERQGTNAERGRPLRNADRPERPC